MFKAFLITLSVLLISQFSVAQNFITTWSVLNGTISFGTATTGPVSYTWQTLPPAAPASGSGTFTGSSATISGIPINSSSNVIVQLNIQPQNFQRIICNPVFFGLTTTLVSINQWGSVAWASMENAFKFSGLQLVNATDIPNLSSVTSLAGMFEFTNVNGPFNINSWNVSTITDMSRMFRTSAFNQAIGSWNTSNVVNMESMFEDGSFNQIIGSWNTSSVTNMSKMFRGNYIFNQNIGNWNTVNVTDMSFMFGFPFPNFPVLFNQNIGNWNTSNVTNMEGMFNGAENFNQDIGNWNTGNVTNMSKMFKAAAAFDQNIGGWNTSNVADMSEMFSPFYTFQGPYGIFNNGGSPSIQNWNISNVTNMDGMFNYAVNFNQQIGNWTLNPTVSLTNMLSFSGMDCENYSLTLFDWSNNPNTPSNRILGAANLSYGNSAVNSVTNLVFNKGWLFSGHFYATLTPTFSIQTVFCSGATIPQLPLVSDNGVEGTWTPALSNIASGTYTFTPNLGQCSDTASLTITIGSNNIPIFNPIPPVCSGGNFAALPTTSLNGIIGTWSPILNNTATTTYTFTPNAGQCATTQTLTITVNPATIPNFNPVGPICVGGSIAPLPATSLNGISGTWSPALSNVITKTYTFQPYSGQCATTQTLTITVNPAVTPNFNVVAPICSGSTLAALPTTSLNGIIGTWSPALNNTVTTTYTFTPSATGPCATNATLTILVNPTILPNFNPIAPICMGASLAALPVVSTNGISGTWSPVLNNTTTTTYTFTPSSGQCALTQTLTIVVNPIITPNFTAVGPICSGSVFTLPTSSLNGITGIWSPALNNTTTTIYTFTPTAGQCATTQSLSVVVTPIVTPVFTPVSPICSGTALSALPTTSNNGITGTWSPTLNNTATTTYTFTPSVGQCASTQTLTITVNPNNIPNFSAISPICSGGTLAPLPTTTLNGISGTWLPALNNTSTTTYTFTPTTGQCATNQVLTITVNPTITPNFSPVPAICSGVNLAPLPPTSSNGITGTWSPMLNNTSTTTYTFTPTTGQCAENQTITITVNPIVTPNFTPVSPVCSGATISPLPTTSINGIVGAWSPAPNNTATTTYTFTPSVGQCATTQSLTIVVNQNITPNFASISPICAGATLAPLPLTSLNGITGSWLPSLNNMATTTYTFAANAGQCASSQTLTITINPNLTPNFASVAPICSGDNLAPLPNISTNGISGTWSPTINNLATTTYTFTPNNVQCATLQTSTIVVNQAVQPTGNSVQSFLPNSTIDDIVISPSSVVWYATLANALANTNQLGSFAVLINGATYYAVNYNGSCKSEPFAVTISITLSLSKLNVDKLKYYPNPVTSVLHIENDIAITSVEVYDLNGKLLISENYGTNAISVDLTSLAPSVYIVKVKSDDKIGEFRIIKD